MEIVIRPARLEDIEVITDIYNQSVVGSNATFDLEPKTIEDRIKWFEEHGEKYPLIVAEIDEKIVGYGSLSRFRPKPAYNATVENSIYIDKEQKGKGIGKRILEELIALAKEFQHHTIIAVITEGNEVSVALHKKLGFEYMGCLKEAGFKFDKWQSVYFYQMII